MLPILPESILNYREISNIRRTKSTNLNVARLVLQLHLSKLLMPVDSFTKEVNPPLAKRPLWTNGRLATGIKSRMKM